MRTGYEVPGAAATSQDALDRDRYLEARRRGIPVRAIHVYLLWSRKKAERVRRRIARADARARLLVKAETLIHREQYQGSTRYGTLGPYGLWYPQFPEHRGAECPQLAESGNIFELMQADLSAQLQAANRRQNELLLEDASLEKQVRELTAAHSKAEEASRAETELAYIEGRNASETTLRGALAARKRLDEALAKHATVSGAINRQRDAISFIQSQIATNRRAGFLAASATLRHELRDQAHAFAEKANAYAELAREWGIDEYQSATALMPPQDLGTPHSNQPHRESFFAVVNAGLELFGIRWAWRTSKAA